VQGRGADGSAAERLTGTTPVWASEEGVVMRADGPVVIALDGAPHSAQTWSGALQRHADVARP
jgi:hypothetical protein